MQKITDTLKAYQSSFREKYAIFLNGKIVLLGNVNVFKTEGIAKRAILNATFGKNTKESSLQKNRDELDKLISDGIISITKL